MRAIEIKLREGIGLDVAALGRPMLERTVRSRMKRLGINRSTEYLRVLDSSPTEWSELVESVVVAETWFFRDPEAFTGLLRFVGAVWLPGARTDPLRLLSLPCASGEEPYSMAMTLLDAGLSPYSFQIQAVDISARCLERARAGVYGRNAFRNKDLEFRRRHFQPVGETFVLQASVRNCVRFEQGNVHHWGYPDGTGDFHVIFCRNLLIYLDPESQAKVLSRLRLLLRPEGALFVGRAEQAVALAHGFVPGQIPTSVVPPPEVPEVSEDFKTEATLPTGLAQPAMGSGRGEKPSLIPGDSPPGNLDEARRLADAGHLKEAALVCETHLRMNQDSATAYYILGLVRDAAGEETALDCYRRAVYLDPHHRESLLQMALIAERRGSHDIAAAFRRRAQRAGPEGARS